MRLTILLLALAILVGGSMAAQTKLDPSVQINWTKSIGSQIHGVTNGDEAQDVVTYAQLHADGILTVGSDAGCDYVTDYSGDQVQLAAALAAGKHVRYVSDLNISGQFNVSSGTIFEGDGDSKITAADGYSATYMLLVTGSNSTVRNVIIDGNKNNTGYSEWGIVTWGSNNTIRDCKVENVSNRGMLISGAYNLVDNCQVLNTGKTNIDYNMGIEILGNYTTIANCKVSRVEWLNNNSGGFGIYGSTIVGGLIENNYVTEASDHIFLSGGTGTIISKNQVIGTAYNSSGSIRIGIDLGREVSTRVKVIDNEVSGMKYGIYSEGCYRCPIRGNTVTSTEYAIFHYVYSAGGMFGGPIEGNDLYGYGAGSGIEIYQATDDIDNVKNIPISGNYIEDFLIGIYGNNAATATSWGIGVSGNTINGCATASIKTTGGATGWNVVGNSLTECGNVTLAGTNIAEHNG